MTQQELQRVKVIEEAAMGRLSVAEAARVLDLSERQAQWWKARDGGLGAARQSGSGQ